MTITSLSLVRVERSTVPASAPGGGDADEVWFEFCLQCGTLDNCGDQLCDECDDLAA